MKAIILATFFLLCVNNSCDTNSVKADELTLPVQEYIGNEIRIDGYWTGIFEFEGETHYGNNYFLYSDGVLFGGISFIESEKLEKEREYIDGTFYTNNSGKQYCWGRFIIEDHLIKFERWYPTYPPRVFIREGEILNDTTFHISRSYRVQDGEIVEDNEKDETYQFIPLTPKPDSTNSFTN